jgi:hypothetical protein
MDTGQTITWLGTTDNRPLYSSFFINTITLCSLLEEIVLIDKTTLGKGCLAMIIFHQRIS